MITSVLTAGTPSWERDFMKIPTTGKASLGAWNQPQGTDLQGTTLCQIVVCEGSSYQTSPFPRAGAIPILFDFSAPPRNLLRSQTAKRVFPSEIMDANRCAHSEPTRDFSEALLSFSQAEQADVLSFFVASPLHRQADLAKEVSRPAPLRWHGAGHVVSSLSHVCFSFTLWLDQHGLPRVWAFPFVSSFQCEGNLQLLLTVWRDVDHDYLHKTPFLVLFCLKLHESNQTRLVHA